MFHLLQDFLVAAESPDLHGFEVGPALPHLPPTLATFALAALTNMLAALGKQETGVKEWICQLPAATREQLLQELEETKGKCQALLPTCSCLNEAGVFFSLQIGKG